MESDWNETVHPLISYHADLDPGFLSRWWDIDYPILYVETTGGPWGRKSEAIVTVNNRTIAVWFLVQEFISLLGFDSTYNSDAMFIEQKSIADGSLIIRKSGIYHLKESITAVRGMSAIIVEADNVIINCNGFTIHGCDSGADAVVVKGGTQRVTICNGNIRDAGANGLHVHSHSQDINLIALDIQNSLANGFLISSNRILILDCKGTYNKGNGFMFSSASDREICLIECLSHNNGGIHQEEHL